MLARSAVALTTMLLVSLSATAAQAQITIGPYSFPDATPFADTASHSGTPMWYGGATDAASALTGYSPTTAAVNVGYPCSDGAEVVELGFTDVVARNGAGFDIVVFDGRFSPDDYEIAVRPAGGAFTTYRPYLASTQRMTGVSGPAGATLWGIEVDLSDFGVPAAGVVDAIRLKGDCTTNPAGRAELDPVMAAVVNAGCACDDGNECTEDSCPSGACVNSALPPGTVCSAGVCDGAASCVECLDDSHCPSDRALCDTSSSTCVVCLTDAGCEDGDECTLDACVDGACASTVAPAGTECSLGVCNGDVAMPACIGCVSDAECGELTPFCVAGMCVECGSDAQCDDAEECSTDACIDGACVIAPLARGSSCSAGVCDGDATAPECVECVADDDCAAPTSRCSAQSRCVECLADAHCDDGDACTDDACSVSGACTHSIASACADASVGADAGPFGGGRTDGGCGCRIGSRRGSPLAWALAVLVVLALGRRRRAR